MPSVGDKAKNGVFAYEQNGKKKKGNADNPEAAELIKKYSLEPKLPWVTYCFVFLVTSSCNCKYATNKEYIN